MCHEDLENETRHWLQYFVRLNERLDVDFASVCPDPVNLFKNVIGNEISIDGLEQQRLVWAHKLECSGLLFEVGNKSIMPLRIAVLVADVTTQLDADPEQAIVNIGYWGERLDFGLSKLGHKTNMDSELWAEYYSRWEQKKCTQYKTE